ncbi:MAG: serine hydrolase domain-containing protein [Chthonomonadales bacterium]
MVKSFVIVSLLSWMTLQKVDDQAATITPANGDSGLAAIIEKIRVKNHLPALAVSVISEGKIVKSAAVGFRKSGNDTPVTLQDQFHIGSCTKSMTATLVQMMVEQGKLKWETTLAELFPELVGKMQPDYRTVTLAMLSAHHAGLTGDPIDGKGVDWRNPGMSIEKARYRYAELALQTKPLSKPGTAFVYSNADYVILGAILERVTKESWESLIRKMLLEPLGMKSAGFGPMGTPGKIDQPYGHRRNVAKSYPIDPTPFSDNPPVLGPAGTVHCSIEDLAKYALFHVDGERGGSKLLSVEGFKTLHKVAYTGDYAAGWMVVDRLWAGGKALFHNGSNTLNYAVMWLGPNKRIGVVAATNQFGGTEELALDEAVSAAFLDLSATLKNP